MNETSRCTCFTPHPSDVLAVGHAGTAPTDWYRGWPNCISAHMTRGLVVGPSVCLLLLHTVLYCGLRYLVSPGRCECAKGRTPKYVGEQIYLRDSGKQRKWVWSSCSFGRCEPRGSTSRSHIAHACSMSYISCSLICYQTFFKVRGLLMHCLRTAVAVVRTDVHYSVCCPSIMASAG